MWIINKLETLKNPSHLITVNRLNIQNQTKLSCSFPILKAKICGGGGGKEKGQRVKLVIKTKGPVGVVHTDSAFQ